MKALSSISCWTKCPSHSRFGPFLLDISFSIRTETANPDKKTLGSNWRGKVAGWTGFDCQAISSTPVPFPPLAVYEPNAVFIPC